MSTLVNKERLMNVLLAPCITEKSALIAQHRQYVFRVINDATKCEIKRAVELLFEVKVDAVQTTDVKSKVKRAGRIEGQRKAWKKAYVKLAEGQKIDFVTA